MPTSSVSQQQGTHAMADEMLIDFQELIGAHTGENLAEAVWETMQSLGLVGKVCTFITTFLLAKEHCSRLLRS